jgi:A/G-specific adenine glycosylase
MAQNSPSQMLDNPELKAAVKLKVPAVRRRLLSWFRLHARSFRWRDTNDAYLVLLSELLLKKTTAPAVDRFLPSFLLRFPDLRSLARAKVDELKCILKPLGLSSQRAGQLAALAKVIEEEHDFDVPNNLKKLLVLPGVGEYTANSVRCVAFGKAAPIVDTNVARILVRVFDVRPTRFEARRSPEIWTIAGALVGSRGSVAKSVNWALLDLGAAICKARRPTCTECPLLANCAFGKGVISGTGSTASITR